MVLVVIFGGTFNSNATTILVSSSGNSPTQEELGDVEDNTNFGYGRSQYGDLTRILNDASDNHVNVVNELEDLDLMLNYDTIWVDQRGDNLKNPFNGNLSNTEIANLISYVSSGGRVILIGENRSWNTWNQQILSAVGGTYSGMATNDILNNNVSALGAPVPSGVDGNQRSYSITDHYLTKDVEGIPVPTVGVADYAPNATQLFDINFITLWNENVVTVLDVNTLYNFTNDDDIQSAQFITNLSYWAAHVEDFIPWYDGRITKAQYFLSESITLEDTVTFDYFCEMSTEPTHGNFEVLFFNGTEWETFKWELKLGGSSVDWASASFYVPTWATGENVQIIFRLKELGTETNPTVYLRNITSNGRASSPVPEPSTIFLFGTGLAGLAGARFRKNKK